MISHLITLFLMFPAPEVDQPSVDAAVQRSLKAESGIVVIRLKLKTEMSDKELEAYKKIEGFKPDVVRAAQDKKIFDKCAKARYGWAVKGGSNAIYNAAAKELKDGKVVDVGERLSIVAPTEKVDEIIKKLADEKEYPEIEKISADHPQVSAA